MKSVLLICGAQIDNCPYINSYIEVFEKNSIPFDLIYWNQHLNNNEESRDNYIPYNCHTDIKYPYWKKFFKIRGFARFAKEYMKRKKYAYVVVFTINHAIFLYPTLQKYYKGRFVFDIRDYSPLCKVSPFRKRINRIIDISSFTVVSSAGFLKWLPNNRKCNYIISHNSTIEMVEKYLEIKEKHKNYNLGKTISILTIGQIAYFDSQKYLVDQLADKDSISLSFVGAGPASEDLMHYVEQKCIKNVSFGGRYLKQDEVSIVEQYNMINIWLKHGVNSDSCMANRFYLSAQLRKPMIVCRNTHQGDLCQKYGLGIEVDESDNFYDEIMKWWKDFDVAKYNKGCKEFLNDVKQDLVLFEQNIVNLYKNV